MKAWIIGLIVLFVLILLAIVKVGIFASYYRERFEVRLVIGPLKLKVGKKKEQKDEANENKALDKRTKREFKKNSKPWMRSVADNWQELLQLIGRVLTAPTLDTLLLKIEVGGKEPDQCAMQYGGICSIVSGVLAALENTFDIKKRSVEIQCRFDKDCTEIEAEAAISLKVYEIIILAAALLKMAIKLYRQTKTNMKVV